ncbi:MAG: peptidase T [Candidatus Limivivens sp.]|nr:peptidase T [Candidatus Limivivens sp.]
MRAYERLLNYVCIPTASSETSGTVPTTQCQFNLAHLLVKEMQEMGITDARVDEKCYVYGTIPATPGYEEKTKLGFIAHMDTVSEFVDRLIQPQLHPDYDGQDLLLGDSGRALEAAVFPHLPSLKGRTLITSDGHTILGADDKAGIAEILTMAEELLKGEIPHGKISIGFTPDEEVGSGADHFDVAGFDAEFAYTVDGGKEGEIEYENFNAASATVTVKGFNIHPGSAKDTMINAGLVAMEYNSMLPAGETPRDTEGYEGFYHMMKVDGCVEKASMSYIIRDHDAESFAERQKIMEKTAEELNKKYGEGTVSVTIKESYRNMAEKIRPCYHLIENAMEAARRAGVEPSVVPIRGGTDGARLSYMGLPCPNLGTGGFAFHGPYEHITAEGMDIAAQTLIEIVKIYAA